LVQQATQAELNRLFGRGEEVMGPVAAEEELQEALGVRMLGACYDDLKTSHLRRAVKCSMTLWYGHVMPSFHATALLGVAHFAPLDKSSKAVWRAAMTIGGHLSDTASIDLDADPVASYPPLLPYPRQPAGMWLDGIGYWLGFRAEGLETSLRFSNPQGDLVAFEKMMFEVAEGIQARAGNRILGLYLHLWRGYCAHRWGEKRAEAPRPEVRGDEE